MVVDEDTIKIWIFAAVIALIGCTLLAFYHLGEIREIQEQRIHRLESIRDSIQIKHFCPEPRYEEPIQNTGRLCHLENYNAVAAYTNGDNLAVLSLITPEQGYRRWTLTNNEPMSGYFNLYLVYYEMNRNAAESHQYLGFELDGYDTKTGILTNEEVWQNKPNNATAYSVELRRPQKEICD